MARRDDANVIVWILAPPIALRDYLDLSMARMVRRLHHSADARNVNQTVAHHAAVEPNVHGVREPIADAESAMWFRGHLHRLLTFTLNVAA